MSSNADSEGGVTLPKPSRGRAPLALDHRLNRRGCSRERDSFSHPRLRSDGVVTVIATRYALRLEA